MSTRQKHCFSGSLSGSLFRVAGAGAMLDGSSEVNPNGSWLNSRGIWLGYCLGLLLLHLAILGFPFLTVAWAWTLTNLLHNVVGAAHTHAGCMVPGVRLRPALLASRAARASKPVPKWNELCRGS